MMKAALYYGADKGLVIGEKDKPTPGENDVLVRIKCASLCHSDLRMIDGQQAPPTVPIVPGHEGLLSALWSLIRR
jgi:D-arabinose 1-dehydrogenase-like Zn-dependent alcohol dehydrogenase